jgi:hypothetical protein
MFACSGGSDVSDDGDALVAARGAWTDCKSVKTPMYK